MWLGMLAAVAGQVPGFPVALFNAINAPLLAYIAQVAAWCGRPSWAYLHVELGATGLIASYLMLAASAIGVPTLLRHRHIAVPQARGELQRPMGRNVEPEATFRPVGGGFGVAGSRAWWDLPPSCWPGSGGAGCADWSRRRPARLRARRRPGRCDPAAACRRAGAAVDGGPPGDGLEAKLRSAGVERLGVAVVTHEESDHAGGVEELLGRFPVARLAYARLSRRLRGEAEAAGARPVRIAKGASLRSGRLRVEVLWPPRELLAAPLAGADPNTQALVLLVRWRDFSMLLTADAEAEAVPLDPGPVDVLKVAHHGSEDAGLDALLDRIVPRLALISVGADNSYGHPTPGHAFHPRCAPRARPAHRSRRHDRPRCRTRIRFRSARAAEHLNRSPQQYWGFLPFGLSPTATMNDGYREMLSKIRQRSWEVGQSLAGDGMLLRLRNASIALVAAVAAVGLGLTLFISQLGFPGCLQRPDSRQSGQSGSVHNAVALSQGPAVGPSSPALGARTARDRSKALSSPWPSRRSATAVA